MPSAMRSVNLRASLLHQPSTQCSSKLSASSLNRHRLIRAIFAANIGSKFITSSLLAKTPERPIEYVDMIGYYVDPQPQWAHLDPSIFSKTLYNYRSQWNKVDMTPSSLPTPGDILTYIDKVNNVVQTILIKNHVFSATRSPFYVVTTIIDKEMDDDSLDQKVSEDVMMKWVQNRIPSAWMTTITLRDRFHSRIQLASEGRTASYHIYYL